MNSDLGVLKRPANGFVPPIRGAGRSSPPAARGRLLLVEDEDVLRDSLQPFLEGHGYEVAIAENGRAALRKLESVPLPDLILLDLAMPVMNGWEFRLLQKDDPRLGVIPVVALSADASAQAAAISAQAYLRKPVAPNDLLATIDRVLVESRQRELLRLSETERLASLGRLAAGVGHEINNPLAFVMLNLSQSIDTLETAIRGLRVIPAAAPPTAPQVGHLTGALAEVLDMLHDCHIGAERIRVTTDHLRRLSRQGETSRGPVQINELLEQSVSILGNQIRHRAHVVRHLGEVPPVRGDEARLGQVFLNLLINAVQAIPEGDAERNQIEIVTTLARGELVPEVMIEIRDSGAGIAPEMLEHVFEPFFTTKPVGEGTGLGLSLSRQTVIDHGGRIAVESAPKHGTVVRVFLPVNAAADQLLALRPPVAALPRPGINLDRPPERGRILVIDDEPLIDRVIRRALTSEHDVFVCQRASEAIKLLERGETFDLVLCDLVMPDIGGPEFHAILAKRWPELLARTVFMTGGAFTPATVEFAAKVSGSILSKPFQMDALKALVRERVSSQRLVASKQQ